MSCFGRSIDNKLREETVWRLVSIRSWDVLRIGGNRIK